MSTITGSSTNANLNGVQTETAMPPNYDDIDPPPSYATLFPGRKAYDFEPSSITANNDTTDDTRQIDACVTSNILVNGVNSSSNSQHTLPSDMPSSSATT